jgi:hypothetical protein
VRLTRRARWKLHVRKLKFRVRKLRLRGLKLRLRGRKLKLRGLKLRLRGLKLHGRKRVLWAHRLRPGLREERPHALRNLHGRRRRTLLLRNTKLRRMNSTTPAKRYQ